MRTPSPTPSAGPAERLLSKSTGAGGGSRLDGPPSSFHAWVWRVSKKQQPWLVGLALLLAGLSAVPLELQRRIVDEAIATRDLLLLVTLGALLFGTFVLNGLLKFIMQVYREAIAADVARASRERLQDAVSRSDEPMDAGGRISVLATEVEGTATFVGAALSELVLSAGTAITMFGYMLFVDPVLALVAGAFFVPQLFVVPLFQRRVNAVSKQRIAVRRALTEALADPATEGFERHTDHLRQRSVRLAFVKAAGKAVVNFLSRLAPITVLVFGGWLVIQGRTELGVLVAFLTGFERLAEPVRALIGYYRTTSLTRTSYDMIADWITPSAKRIKGDRA